MLYQIPSRNKQDDTAFNYITGLKSGKAVAQKGSCCADTIKNSEYGRKTQNHASILNSMLDMSAEAD
jgi:hypothetical protein